MSVWGTKEPMVMDWFGATYSFNIHPQNDNGLYSSQRSDSEHR